MPSASLRLAQPSGGTTEAASVLPEVLRTRSGTIMLDVQGVINVGERPLIRTELDLESSRGSAKALSDEPLSIGSIDLKGISEDGLPVRLLVGEHQMLRGRLQKLRMPLALLKMPKSSEATEIPVLEIITHKVLFDKRPEPVVQ